MTITDPQKARTITLTEGAWSALDTASPDIIKTLQDLHVVMHRLSCENDLDQPQVNATLRLAARAVRSMEDKDVHAAERLDHGIRHANPGSLANRGGQPGPSPDRCHPDARASLHPHTVADSFGSSRPGALCLVAVRLAWPLHLSPGKGPPLRMVKASTVSLAFKGFKTVFTDAWLETPGQCRQDRDDGAVGVPRRNLWLARPGPVAARIGRAVARVKTLVANGGVPSSGSARQSCRCCRR